MADTDIKIRTTHANTDECIHKVTVVIEDATTCPQRMKDKVSTATHSAMNLLQGRHTATTDMKQPITHSEFTKKSDVTGLYYMILWHEL